MGGKNSKKAKPAVVVSKKEAASLARKNAVKALKANAANWDSQDDVDDWDWDGTAHWLPGYERVSVDDILPHDYQKNIVANWGEGVSRHPENAPLTDYQQVMEEWWDSYTNPGLTEDEKKDHPIYPLCEDDHGEIQHVVEAHESLLCTDSRRIITEGFKWPSEKGCFEHFGFDSLPEGFYEVTLLDTGRGYNPYKDKVIFPVHLKSVNRNAPLHNDVVTKLSLVTSRDAEEFKGHSLKDSIWNELHWRCLKSIRLKKVDKSATTGKLKWSSSENVEWGSETDLERLACKLYWALPPGKRHRRLPALEKSAELNSVPVLLAILALVLILFWFLARRFRAAPERRCLSVDLEANLQEVETLHVD